MFIWFPTLVGCVIFSCLVQFIQSFNCPDAYSCAYDSSISSTNASIIICTGAHSCSAALTIETTTTSDGATYCSGSYSCYMATNVLSLSNASTTSNIICRGLLSCAFITRLYNTNDWVQCDGERSCYSSNIYFEYGLTFFQLV